jgi:hypothetical protein
MKVTTIHPRDEGHKPPPSIEERVRRLESVLVLLIRHLRGQDVMSELELQRMEEDLQK